MEKYKLSWRDISFKDFKVYLFALFKAFIPKKKIKNLDELEYFIQSKSAWVSQVTLYSYLKTRMGTKYVLHFDNDVFMSSVNLAKWNIYSVALQDLTFFTFSYLKVNSNYKNVNQAKEIFNKILQTIHTENIFAGLNTVLFSDFDFQLGKEVEIEIEPKVNVSYKDKTFIANFNRVGDYNIKFYDLRSGEKKLLFS